MNELEVSTITKTGHGYELTDSTGNIIGSFKDWEPVAEIFREQDFSEEYICKRLADLTGLRLPWSTRRTSNVRSVRKTVR